MNENQLKIKNYVLIVKTIDGNPDDDITVRIQGSLGETDRLLLGKSQVEMEESLMLIHW